MFTRERWSGSGGVEVEWQWWSIGGVTQGGGEMEGGVAGWDGSGWVE